MIGVVAASADANHWLVETSRGTLRVHFDPLRFADPWPVPEVGDRVMLITNTRGTWSALWILGRGVPTYERVQG